MGGRRRFRETLEEVWMVNVASAIAFLSAIWLLWDDEIFCILTGALKHVRNNLPYAESGIPRPRTIRTVLLFRLVTFAISEGCCRNLCFLGITEMCSMFAIARNYVFSRFPGGLSSTLSIQYNTIQYDIIQYNTR